MVNRADMFPISHQTDGPQFSKEAAFSLSDEAQVTKLLSGMGIRYFFALLIIACLACTAYFIMHDSLKTNESNGAIVNISGRQRMLSQRGALFSLRLATAEGREKIIAREKLMSVATLMMDSHQALIKGSEKLGLPAHMSDEMKKLYFEAPTQLDKQVLDYIKSIKRVVKASDEAWLTLDNPDLHTILEVAPDRLLKTLNSAVKQYEVEGFDEIQKTKRWETYVVLITLLALVLEGLFIFRPIISKVKKTANALLQEKHFSENVVNTAQALILGIDTKGNIQLFNQYAEDTTQWLEQELLETNFISRFIPQQKQNTVIRLFREMFSGKLESQFESQLMTRDERLINIAWSNRLILDPATKKPLLLIATGIIQG